MWHCTDVSYIGKETAFLIGRFRGYRAFSSRQLAKPAEMNVAERMALLPLVLFSRRKFESVLRRFPSLWQGAALGPATRGILKVPLRVIDALS